MREEQPLPPDWNQICLPDQRLVGNGNSGVGVGDGEGWGVGGRAIPSEALWGSLYSAEYLILHTLELEWHSLEMPALSRLVAGGS